MQNAKRRHASSYIAYSRIAEKVAFNSQLHIGSRHPKGTRLRTESPHPNWPGGAAYRGVRHDTLRNHPHPLNPEGP